MRTREVINYHQDIFIPSFALVEVQKVNRNKLKWVAGDNIHEWCSSFFTWLLLFQTGTTLGHKKFNFSLHFWPEEPVFPLRTWSFPHLDAPFYYVTPERHVVCIFLAAQSEFL